MWIYFVWSLPGANIYNSPGLQSLMQQIQSNPSLMQNMMQAPYMQSMMRNMADNPDMAAQVNHHKVKRLKCLRIGYKRPIQAFLGSEGKIGVPKGVGFWATCPAWQRVPPGNLHLATQQTNRSEIQTISLLSSNSLRWWGITHCLLVTLSFRNRWLRWCHPSFSK